MTMGPVNAIALDDRSVPPVALAAKSLLTYGVAETDVRIKPAAI